MLPSRVALDGSPEPCPSGLVSGRVWLMLGTGAAVVLLLGIGGVALARANRASG